MKTACFFNTYGKIYFYIRFRGYRRPRLSKHVFGTDANGSPPGEKLNSRIVILAQAGTVKIKAAHIQTAHPVKKYNAGLGVNFLLVFFISICNNIQSVLKIVKSPSSSRPRTSPFHGGNTGSNPVGDAIFIIILALICFFALFVLYLTIKYLPIFNCRRRGSGAEQLIRNQRVVGSIPIAGSIFSKGFSELPILPFWIEVRKR